MISIRILLLLVAVYGNIISLVDSQTFFPFLALGVTDGVTKEVLTRADDGHSSSIDIPVGFPFGSSTETAAYVTTNGYFTLRHGDSSCCPPFSGSLQWESELLIAPYWSDNDVRVEGAVWYEVHTTGSPLLQQVNSFISSHEEISFGGTWMLVGEWNEVREYPHALAGQPDPTNTYQGILVTNGYSSYAVFIYNCDLMGWSGGAVIGYTAADTTFYESHYLSGTRSEEIACLNSPASPWSNVVYRLIVYYPAPAVTIRTEPNVTTYPAATKIFFACDIQSDLSVTYNWTVYCSSQGPNHPVFKLTNNADPGELSLNLSSTPLECTDTVVCSAKDSVGSLGQASLQISSVTGVGLWGTSEPISNNSALIASATGEIGALYCHSASPQGNGRWIGPSGSVVMDASFETSAVLRSYYSYSTLQLTHGSSLSSSDQGVYSCIIPDENGEEQTLHIGVYSYGHSDFISITSIQRTSEDPLTISCMTTGTPPTTVTWEKGPTDLSQSDGGYQMTQILSDRTSSSFSNVLTTSGEAFGLYSCTVRSEITGPVQSHDGPTLLTDKQYFGLYTVGYYESITCTTHSASRIEWVYNYTEVVTSASGDMAVLGFTVNDSIHNGVYTCRGYSDETYTDLDVTIIAQVPTTALSVSVSQAGSMAAGEEHSLVCIVSETVGGLTNRATLQWHDPIGNPVTTGGGVTLNELIVQSSILSQTVTFDTLQTSHAGEYTCHARLTSPALTTSLEEGARANVTIQMPVPVVSVSSEGSTAIAGSSHTLTCSVQLSAAVNTPVIVTSTWRKAGTPLSNSDRLTLSSPQQISSSLYQSTITISPLSHSIDAGVYSCEASIAPNPSSLFISESSSATSTYSLTVQAPSLSASIDPPSLSVLNADSYNTVTLQCTAIAPDGVVETKGFQWTRRPANGGMSSPLTDGDGTVTIQNSNVNDATSTSLLSMQESTAGSYTYTCTTTLQLSGDSNVVGSATVDVTVRGPSLPDLPTNLQATVQSFTSALIEWDVSRIAYTPEQYVVTYGTSASSLTETSATVASSADITAQNQHYSVQITGLVHGTSYFYVVMATNTHGDMSSGVQTFTVEDIPVIVSISAHGSADAGETYSLTCTASEEENITATLVLTWYSPDGQPLSSGGDITVSTPVVVGSTTNISLQFSPLRTAHSGEYTCQAEIPELGFTERVTHIVSVTVGELTVTIISSTSSDYRAANPLTLTCQVGSDADGALFYLWSSTCSGDCFVDGQRTATVARSALRAVDSGTHTCSVTDSVGNAGSASIHVAVTGVGLYSSVRGLVGNNSMLLANSQGNIGTLECISGSTTPYLGQWISPSGHDITGDTSDPFTVTLGDQNNPGYMHISLVPGRTLSSDSQGVYTCISLDETGTEHQIHVGIYSNGFSTPISISSLDHGSSGDNFTITCTSTGSPATSVTWTRDGTPLTTDGVAYQTLRDGTTATYDNYLVVDEGPAALAGSSFACSTTNEINTATDTLTINGIQIDSRFFTVGENGSIVCSTDLDATRTEWLYGNDVVIGSDGSQAEVCFAPVNDSLHNRVYTCKTYTPYGEQRQSVTVLVEVVPDAFAVGISTESARPHAGQQFTVTCTVMTAAGFQQPPEVEWLDTSRQHITTGGDITVSDPVHDGTTTTTTLQFSPLRLSHGGEVTCRANVTSPAPPYHLIKTAEWDLIVASPPFDVRVDPDIITVFDTESFTLTCTAVVHGSVLVPKSFHWGMRQLGREMVDLNDNGGSTVINSRNLDNPTSTSELTTIESVPGSYQIMCTVVLQFPGEIDDIAVNDSSTVTIKGPQAPATPMNVSALNATSQSVLIIWRVQEVTYTSEQYVVQYGLDERNLAQESSTVAGNENASYKVALRDLLSGATYYYRVVATNTFASTESDIGTFQTPTKESGVPGPVQNFNIQVSGPTTLTFSWDEHTDGNDIIGYTIQCSPSLAGLFTDSLVETVDGFTPATTYTCSIFATNINGDGEATSQTVTTADGIPGKVAGIDYQAVSDQKIRVNWSEPINTNGSILRYNLVVTSYVDASIVFTATMNAGGEMSLIVNDLEPLVPYRVSITAQNSNPVAGDSKSIPVFSREGSPAVAPRNVETSRLNETHMSISWSPLTLVEARGFVLYYTITYETLANRKREVQTLQVPEGESVAVIGGLEAGSPYTVAITASTSAGAGPPAVKTVEAPCINVFQLLLSEVHDCNDWRFHRAEEKLMDLTSSVVSSITDHCKCSLAKDHIVDGEFLCLDVDPEAVIFRAKLTGSECTQLLSYMEEWVSSGQASALVQGNRLIVDPSCMVGIESLNSAPGCSRPTTAATVTGGTDQSAPATSVPVIAAAVGVVFAVVVVIALVIIIVCWCCRRGSYKVKPHREQRHNLEYNNAYGAAAEHCHVAMEEIEMGVMNPQMQRYDSHGSAYVEMNAAAANQFEAEINQDEQILEPIYAEINNQHMGTGCLKYPKHEYANVHDHSQ